MDDLHTLLRDADPLAREGELAAADAVVMRRRVIAAAAPAPPGGWSWRVALAFAVVALLAGVAARFDSTSQRASEAALPRDAFAQPRVDVRMPGPSTQLQFVAPGGTRIVWVLNPDLDF